MPSRKLRVPVLAGAIVALLVAATPVAAADNAMVRVLHASPDAPAVDVYVDGEKVGAPLAGLEFGDLSEYVSLPAGTYDIKVCAAADAHAATDEDWPSAVAPLCGDCTLLVMYGSGPWAARAAAAQGN